MVLKYTFDVTLQVLLYFLLQTYEGQHFAAGRAESTDNEKDKLKVATFRTPIHSTTERWVATAYHPFNIFNNGMTRM